MKPPGKLVPPALRRTVRIPIEAGSLLVGFDSAGKQRLEQAKTSVVRRSGASLTSTHLRCVGQALILRQLQSYEEIEVRVVREISHAEGAYGYAAALLNPDAESWREPCTLAVKKRAQAYRYSSEIYRSRPRLRSRDQWFGVKQYPRRSRLQKHRARLRAQRFEVAPPYSPGSPCIPLSSETV